jgi:hypothetical protein
LLAHRQSTVPLVILALGAMTLMPRLAVAGAPASEGCLASALCSLRQRVNARKGAWTPAFCQALADGVLTSARRHELAPALLLAVMMNESDLDEKAARVSHPDGGLAKDSGLMGIRCVIGPRGRCTNGFVKGMAWRAVMDPLTNVELGAVYLAHYRDGGGRSTIQVRTRDADGTIGTRVKNVPCAHRDHAYWAHYNHGTHFISHGQARLYPHHVAVLQDALAETLGLDRELASPHYTLRSLQRAEGAGAQRYLQLSAMIRAESALCPAVPALAAKNDHSTSTRL